MARKALRKRQKIQAEVAEILTLPHKESLTEMMAGIVSRSKKGQLKTGEYAFFAQFQRIKVMYLSLEKEIEHLKKLHAQSNVMNEDGPTPETVAKLKPTAINYLAERNIITPEELQAALDISRAYQLITDPVKLKLFKYAERIGHSEPRDWTLAEIALKVKFQRWMNQILIGRHDPAIVHDAIVEEMSLNDLQRRWGCRKQTIAETIKHALNDYVKIAQGR